MRLHISKEAVYIWDIVDDISFNDKDNYMIKHFYERMAIYRESEYPINEQEIYL